MTKEEQWIKGSIENYIFAYTGKRAKISDADAQHFTASVMSYLNLCTPSLQANLDEAAEKSAKSWRKNPDGSESRELFFQPYIRGFKAGAEWMAGQFEKNRLDALSKVKALRDAQNMHAKTLNYGYRCLAIRLGKEVDEMLDKLKIK